MRTALAILIPSSLVGLLWPALARAENADSLSTFDGEPAPTAPATPSVVVVEGPRKGPASLPIRAERRLAVVGELGWNTLAGFGPNLTFHADPHLSFDLGAGLSLLGWKLGLRSRYNFLTQSVTPFVGVGVMGAAGLGNATLPFEDDNGNATATVRVLPAAFMQTVVGIDWTRHNGFTLLGALGYALLLSHDPVEIVSGKPTPDQERGLDVAFRSNLVISLAIGYSFK